MKLYIAGPMTGLPQFNFPAFLAAAKSLRDRGHEVFCPAEWDLQNGFDPNTSKAHPLRSYMAHDLPEVLKSDAVVVLPGWEKSKGARLEVQTAKTCDIPVLTFPDLNPLMLSRENILQEADRIVMGQRQSEYDHPLENHMRIADFWTAYLRHRKHSVQELALTAEDVARLMLFVKIARDMFSAKRDSVVDIAGYARCLERIRAKLGDSDYVP